MQVPVESARVEVGQLRELLTVDRCSAGEARPAHSFAPLKTIAYSKPWRIQAKRRWRSDRRLRIVSWSCCLAAIAALILLQIPLWNTATALTGEPRGSSPIPLAHDARATPAHARVAPATSMPQPASAASSAADPSRLERGTQQADPHAGLSPRRRLGRADLWLRIGTPRGAREARSLIESSLSQVPGDAHGQAALAEACLRLHDQACARAAIDEAMRTRPWRGGYRVLSRKIDAAFASPAEHP